MNSIEREVLELIGEDPDSPDVFTDTSLGMAQIRGSINDAIQEISMVTGSFKREYFIPLRSETGFYRLAFSYGYLGWVTDAWLVNLKYRLNQVSPIRLSAEDPRWMVSKASPRSYLQIGTDVIGVYPKPSANGDLVRLNIVEIPTPYEDGEDRIKLRQDFHYAAVQYAMSEYWASRGDAREATAHFSLYLDALGMSDAFGLSSQAHVQYSTQKDTGARSSNTV